MNKLYYIRCRSDGESWICDVTDSILEVNKLLKEYQLDDPHSKFKIAHSLGENEIPIGWFNKERVKTYLGKDA